MYFYYEKEGLLIDVDTLEAVYMSAEEALELHSRENNIANIISGGKFDSKLDGFTENRKAPIVLEDFVLVYNEQEVYIWYKKHEYEIKCKVKDCFAYMRKDEPLVIIINGFKWMLTSDCSYCYSCNRCVNSFYCDRATMKRRRIFDSFKIK